MLYPPLLMLAYLVGALFIAQRAQAAWRPAGVATARLRLAFLALALLALALIGLLPLAGPLVMAVTTLTGLGACVLEWQHRRPPTPPALPA